MDKPEILMYTMTTCGYCAKMKKELDEAGVIYTERDYKEYMIPNRDFNSPQEAIQSLQYYQSITHRDQTIEDVIELVKNNMYMTKMLIDKMDYVVKKIDEQDQKRIHHEELQKRRRESVEKNKRMAEEINSKRQEASNSNL